jgi:hypothetical protein
MGNLCSSPSTDSLHNSRAQALANEAYTKKWNSCTGRHKFFETRNYSGCDHFLDNCPNKDACPHDCRECTEKREEIKRREFWAMKAVERQKLRKEKRGDLERVISF